MYFVRNPDIDKIIMMKSKFNKCVYLLKVIFANVNRVCFYCI